MEYGLGGRHIKDLNHAEGRGTKGTLPYKNSNGIITITDEEFFQLAAYIKDNYGINLKEEKKALVMSRLHSVLSKNGFKSFTEYYDYIMSDKTGRVAAMLINKITTNHTFFMRGIDHFDYLQDKALPYFKDMVKNKDLRIWSAGCATGEEPYTMAMVIDEFFGKEKKSWDTKILATDISEKALKIAVKGVYDNKKIATLPSKWKIEYFKQLDINNSIIIDRIKNEVIYRKFNLMDKTFPFKQKFHIIFCRNVMIYFDIKTKMELINKFYEITEPGGYLFIGHSESLIREKTKYNYVMPAVYRKD